MTRSVAVSDGTRPIGSVVERDDGFQAIDIEGRTVGFFRSEPAAASALWLHDRRLPIVRTTRDGDVHRQIEALLRDEFDNLAHEAAAERDSDA